MDWSLGGLKTNVMGLLEDPNKVQGMLGNPWFGAGMGLLSENQKPGGGNPFMGAITGLAGSKEQKQADEDRKRMEKLREELAELIRRQSAGAPPGSPQMSPAPGAVSPEAQQLMWKAILSNNPGV